MKLPKTYIDNLGSGTQRSYAHDIPFVYFVTKYGVIPNRSDSLVSLDALSHALNNLNKGFTLVHIDTNSSKSRLNNLLPKLKGHGKKIAEQLHANGSLSFIYSNEEHADVHIEFDVHPKSKKIDLDISYHPECEASLSFVYEFTEKFKYKKDAGAFAVLYKDDMGLTLKSFETKVPDQIDLSLNYGESFEADVHANIVERMQDSKGLYLFHGEPGTGKSTYIKYLASCLPDKTFVYIPDFMVEMIARPDAIGLFLENKDLVLVLEDAEKAIASRETTNNPLISTLLNLTDGILSDILDLNVIVSYNTETEKVDSALLRKGRLRFKHEFKNLTKDRAIEILRKKKLSQSKINDLIEQGEIKNNISLGDIYHIMERNRVSQTPEATTPFGFTK